MFCSVQYGYGSQVDGNYFNINCGTASFKDFLREKAMESLTTSLEKQRDIQRKQISMLTRQVTAHTRHLQKLQKKTAPKDGTAAANTATTAAGTDDPSGGAGGPGSGLARDNVEKVQSWMGAAEEEIKKREEALVKIEEYDMALQEMTGIDLQDSESGTFVDIQNMPVHMMASAVLPLRSTTVLYGIREGKDPMSLVLSAPDFSQQNPLIEEMLTQGVLQKRSAAAKTAGGGGA